MNQDPARIKAIIEEWKSAGLQINTDDDHLKAAHYLARIGEQRLLAYTQPFREGYGTTGRFKPRIGFQQIHGLYKFDRWLRLLMLDGLERVEISLKSDLQHELISKYGDDWPLKASFVIDCSRDVQPGGQARVASMMSSIKGNICRDRTKKERKLDQDEVVRRRLSRNPTIAFSAITFGNISKLIEHVPEEIRSSIAARYQLSGDELKGLLDPLTTIRNISAHHEQLWNIYLLNKTITLPAQYQEVLRGYRPNPDYQKKIYGACLAVYYIVRQIARNTKWHERLDVTLELGSRATRPLNLSRLMAFPSEWREVSLWNWSEAHIDRRQKWASGAVV